MTFPTHPPQPDPAALSALAELCTLLEAILGWLLPGFCAALRAALLRNPAPDPIPATPHRNPRANKTPRTTRARAPSARRRARTVKTAKPKPRRASRAWTAGTRAWRVLVVPMARPRSARAPPRPKISACIIEIR